MIVAVDQTTWDLWGQIGVWLIGFPLFIGILVLYIAAQITTERRENQKLAGRWGAKSQSKSDTE
ncbi:MAG: hypothetical protein JHD16_06590 [Solirubrobacteraceae bacterium]|nr:hypothetical protein [Solirubrobacteraceae bacterium]